MAGRPFGACWMPDARLQATPHWPALQFQLCRDSRGPVAALELLVEIDRGGELPLHEQLERSLREHIRSGRLPAARACPPRAALASELGVSRGVVTEAYGQLAAEGYLRSARARPCASRAPCAPRRRARRRVAAGDASPTTSIPACPTSRASRARRGCARCARRCATRRSRPSATATRAASRSCAKRSPSYLGRVRGAASDPEHMLVCTGFMQGLSLVCRMLRSRGVERVALEDPGWHTHRLIVEQAGMEVVPCRSTRRGCASSELARTRRRGGASSPPRTSSPPARCSAPSAGRR